MENNDTVTKNDLDESALAMIMLTEEISKLDLNSHEAQVKMAALERFIAQGEEMIKKANEQLEKKK